MIISVTDLFGMTNHHLSRNLFLFCELRYYCLDRDACYWKVAFILGRRSATVLQKFKLRTEYKMLLRRGVKRMSLIMSKAILSRIRRMGTSRCQVYFEWLVSTMNHSADFATKQIQG